MSANPKMLELIKFEQQIKQLFTHPILDKLEKRTQDKENPMDQKEFRQLMDDLSLIPIEEFPCHGFHRYVKNHPILVNQESAPQIVKVHVITFLKMMLFDKQLSNAPSLIPPLFIEGVKHGPNILEDIKKFASALKDLGNDPNTLIIFDHRGSPIPLLDFLISEIECKDVDFLQFLENLGCKIKDPKAVAIFDKLKVIKEAARTSMNNDPFQKLLPQFESKTQNETQQPVKSVKPVGTKPQPQQKSSQPSKPGAGIGNGAGIVKKPSPFRSTG